MDNWVTIMFMKWIIVSKQATIYSKWGVVSWLLQELTSMNPIDSTGLFSIGWTLIFTHWPDTLAACEFVHPHVLMRHPSHSAKHQTSFQTWGEIFVTHICDHESTQDCFSVPYMEIEGEYDRCAKWREQKIIMQIN